MRWLAIAVLAACGHAAPPPGPTPGTTHVVADAGVADTGPVGLESHLDELAKRSTQLYKDLARALDEANGDCAAATSKIDALVTTYADVTAANARVLHAGHDRVKQLKAALAPYEDELDAAAKKIVESPTMRACSQDAGFAKVMDRLVGE